MIALLIDLSVKATLLCLAAVVVTAMMRRASAASRHLVWAGMFLAVLALPIARVLMPAARVRPGASRAAGRCRPRLQ